MYLFHLYQILLSELAKCTFSWNVVNRSSAIFVTRFLKNKIGCSSKAAAASSECHENDDQQPEVAQDEEQPREIARKEEYQDLTDTAESDDSSSDDSSSDDDMLLSDLGKGISSWNVVNRSSAILVTRF